MVRLTLLLVACLFASQLAMAQQPINPATIGGFRATCVEGQRGDPASIDGVVAQVGNFSHCTGYLAGLMDGYRIGTGVLAQTLGADYKLGLPMANLCVPDEGLSVGMKIQLLDAFAERENLSNDDSTRMEFFMALMDMFPCGGHVPDQ